MLRSTLPIALAALCALGVRGAGAATLSRWEDQSFLSARETFLYAQEARTSERDESVRLLGLLSREHRCEATACLLELVGAVGEEDRICHASTLEGESRAQFAREAAEALAAAGQEGIQRRVENALGRSALDEEPGPLGDACRLARAAETLPPAERGPARLKAAREATDAGSAWLALRLSVMAAEDLLEADRAAESLSVLSGVPGLDTDPSDCPDPRWIGSARTVRAEAILKLGDPVQSLAAIREALQVIPAQDVSPRARAHEIAARACLHAARDAMTRADDLAARAFVEEGLAHETGSAEPRVEGRLLVERATLIQRSGALHEAVPAMRQALETCRSAAEDEGMSLGAERLAGIVGRSAPGEAALLLRESAEAAGALGDDHRVGEMLVASAETARVADLRREARRSIQIADSGDWGTPEPEAADRLRLVDGRLLLREGKWREAIAALERVRGTGDDARMAAWGRAAAAWRMGDAGRARQEIPGAVPPGWPAEGLDPVPDPLVWSWLMLLDGSGRRAEAGALAAGLSRTQVSPVLSVMLLLRTNPEEGRARARQLLAERAGAEGAAAALEAAALAMVLEEGAEARRQIARARRAGADPSAPALDLLLDP